MMMKGGQRETKKSMLTTRSLVNIENKMSAIEEEDGCELDEIEGCNVEDKVLAVLG